MKPYRRARRLCRQVDTAPGEISLNRRAERTASLIPNIECYVGPPDITGRWLRER
jgi:hypothetical protein